MMDFTSSPELPAIGAVIPGRAPCVSIDYHEEGNHLYVASEADSRLAVVNCLTGKQEQVAIKCERERIHLVKATHHNQCILFAGKGSREQPVGQRNAVNYHSIYDNKILRKFRGHADEVTNLSMSPADDSFLSSSKDRTVRLWNIQQAGSLAQLELPATASSGNPQAVFDSTGLVFAVTAPIASGEKGGQYVHLYDARQYGAGGFAELQVHEDSLEKAIQTQVPSVTPNRAQQLSRGKWTSIDFNSSGNQLIVGTEHGMVLVLDGFEATVQRVFYPSSGVEDIDRAVCCFTPDDKTVLAGRGNGVITCYNVQTGTSIKTLTGHTSRISCIAANPKYSQFASCCSNIALWTW